MCMAANDCKLQERVNNLESEVTELRGDVTRLKSDVAELRNESAQGFKALNEKLDAMIAPVVAEKVKWGDTVRSIVTWAARVILLGAATAMGVTAYKMSIGS